MEIWIPLLATALFGYFGLVSFYAGVKPYQENEERGFDDAFSYSDGPFAIIGLFFAFVLWGSNKLFSPPVQLIVFRGAALVMALLMMGLIYLSWYVYFN
ncbi:hypothetical protein [Planococcus sp. 107-1]|uniref:hypothetical protein n=1 Tax=Planococcus sp. 107-1 TaxID=2908840 RepID=UPI001F416A19|nr:hypothetical protein [Planococcus sp. 107-1]UJF28446.1 hypothetical protein L0M13_09130 [Planococcus sp. 107-1]